MTLNLSHRATAWFQAVLSIVFIVGYFVILYLFVSGKAKIDPDYHDLLLTLMGVLTGSVGVIVQFWFSRQRASDEPDAKTTTTSVTTSTSPAGVPPVLGAPAT